MKRTEYIKVNLPYSEEQFINGNGEGCFVLVDKETYKAWEDDSKVGGVYKGTLDNYSLYYPELKPGVEIKFELRGENRPVALLDKYAGEYEKY